MIFGNRRMLDPNGGGGGGETPEQLAARLKAEEDAKRAQGGETVESLKAALAAKEKAYLETQADLHKRKEALSVLEAQRKAEAEDKLKSEQKWQELAQLKAKEAEELQGRVAQLQDGFIRSKEGEAILAEAVSQGMDPAARDVLLMLPRIGVVSLLQKNLATGASEVAITGAKEFVASLVQQKPFLFKRPGSPGINPGNPSAGSLPGTPGEITPAHIAELEKSEKPEDKAKLASILGYASV